MLDIKQNISLCPLALPDDLNDSIWAYYPIIQVSPIMMEGFLIVILLITLVDKSLQIDLYKVYNLSAPHPDLKVNSSMFLRENIWPSQHPVHMPLCLLPMKFAYALHHGGHHCALNTALYPVDKIEWCMYALFIRNQDLVREQCLVPSCIRHANLALNFDGYI